MLTEKEKTRFLEQNILNLGFGQFYSSNKYSIPDMLPMEPIEHLVEIPLQGFNFALGDRHPERKGCHFFLHDYQFERVWNTPNKYLNTLKKYKYVLSPDFSPYSDMPKCLQIFNVYRNRWCGRFWQENGITVIPTVTWSSDETVDFCLAGIPKYSVIAISTMGEGRWAHYKSLYKNWDKVMEKLEPKQILLYGKDLSKNLSGNIVYKRYNSSKI